MKPEEMERIIREYLQGKDTPEGKALFEQWFAREPFQGLDASNESEQEASIARLVNRVERSLDGVAEKPVAKDAPIIPFRAVSQKPFYGTALFRWAASLLLLLVAAGIANLAIQRGGWFTQQPAITFTTVTNAGQTPKRVQLADGSAVLLNQGGTLRYPQTFTGPSRPVYLEGEAYFQVARNVEKPFLVEAGSAVVQVLGTSFNVRESKHDTTVLVVVTEGKVSLRHQTASPTDAALLSAGTIGYLQGSGRVTTEQTGIVNYLSWYNGRLLFEQTSLAQVARQLSHLYGIEVVLQNEQLGKLPLTANIRRDSLPVVLDKIAFALGVEYTRERNRITIKPK